MHTQAVLSWFRVALPLLAAPGVFVQGVELSEGVLLQLGHDIVDGAVGSWLDGAPEAAVRALEAAGAALTAVQVNADPGPSLRESLDATVAYLGGGEEVEGLLLVGRGFPEPVEPSGGQHTPTPAERARPTIPDAAAGIPKLRGAFFRHFGPWADQAQLKGSARREARHAIQAAWYGERTSLADIPPKGCRSPEGAFWAPGSDPGRLGTLAWLGRLEVLSDEYTDAVIVPYLNHCKE